MTVYANEHNTVYVYKNPDGSYSEFYFKTVAQQVDLPDESNMQEHVSNVKGNHLGRFDVDKVRNSGAANGLLIYDDNGWIPIDNIDPSMVLTRIEFKNIAEMLEKGATVLTHAMVMVLDASDDPTVTREGIWAMYRRTDSDDFDNLERGWLKVAEGESLDIKTDWPSLVALGIMPISSVEDIDEMVTKEHSHDNKETLDGFLVGSDGYLRHNGRRIGFMSEVTKFFVGDYIPDDTIRPGDLWIKASPGQMWWDDPGIEYAGTTCYERFKDEDTMVDSPKLRTQDSISFRRMFYRCYMLENVQEYNVRAASDFYGMFEECSSIRAIPCMNTYSGQKFDRMFYGCHNLLYGAEMYLNFATSVSEMYSGCPNLVRVLPFGTTSRVQNMKAWFNGCSALERIDSRIDMSSIVTEAAVANMFNECYALREIRFEPESLRVSISFAGTDLSYESMKSVLDAAVVIDDGSEKTIDFTDITDAHMLTSEDIAGIQAKGWTVIGLE